MARAYPIGRTLFLVLLGLLGLGLLLEGLWLGWQGESMASIWMILGCGATLTGTAWWLLFRAPLSTLSDMGSYIYRWPSADTQRRAGRMNVAGQQLLGQE